MKFIVIGPARAGKTTVGAALARAFDTKATDTSEAVVAVEVERQDRLIQHLCDTFDLTFDSLRDSLREDPDLWDADRDRPARPLLVATGDALKKLGPTSLADYCFQQGDVCVGVRRKDELLAVCGKYPDARVLWVDRQGVFPDPKDNLDIPWEWADYHFSNDGDLAGVDAFGLFMRHSVDEGWLPEPRTDLAIQVRP